MPGSGGCLCGAVRFELAGDLGPIVACHCSYCRRAHGAPFVNVSLVPSAALRWTAGASEIVEWKTPAGGRRAFCGRCATRLYNRPKRFPEHVSLVVGCLDPETGRGPEAHINVESKAPWYEIRDGLPQFDALPKGPAAEGLR